MNYGRFFYLNNYKKRYFKFTTIYQQRQFINRFGDYTIDWKDTKNDDQENENQDVVDMIMKDSSGKFPSLVNFSVGLFGLVECID